MIKVSINYLHIASFYSGDPDFSEVEPLPSQKPTTREQSTVLGLTLYAIVMLLILLIYCIWCNENIAQHLDENEMDLMEGYNKLSYKNVLLHSQKYFILALNFI